jgi:hypothetical protein
MMINWTPEILAATAYRPTAAQIAAGQTSTFVSVLANGSCSNNLQVFEIDPQPAFTLDITNLDGTDDSFKPYGEDVPQCVDVVRSASYSAGEILMNYGTNVLYFEVISANFVTSWTPTFQIIANSLDADQSADISWFPTLEAAKLGTAPIESALDQADGAVIAGTIPLTTTVTNTAAGVSVFVRVVINNNNYESITDKAFVLAVDGEDSTGQWDLDNSAGSTTCDVTLADQKDQSSQTINPRPEIIDQSATPAGPLAPSFVPKN